MIKNIAVSGGGLRGLYYIGVLKYLEEKKLLNGIKNYSGTSVGTIFCLLLILEYKHDDLINIFELFDVNNLKQMDLINMMNNFSLFSNTKIKRLISLFIKNKLNKNKITLKELFNITQKVFHIVTINIETGKQEIFNKDLTPDIDVCDAIMASCGFPLIFPISKINNGMYIDGCILNNFPYDIFKDDLENTLGLEMRSYMKSKRNKINDLTCYLSNIYNLVLDSLGNKPDKDKKPKYLVIFKNKILYELNDFKKNIKKIVEEGYEDTKRDIDNIL